MGEEFEDDWDKESLIPGDNDFIGPGQFTAIIADYNPDAPNNLTRIPPSDSPVPIVTPVSAPQ